MNGSILPCINSSVWWWRYNGVRDNPPFRKVKIIWNWFLEHDSKFTLPSWPPESLHLRPTGGLWDVAEWEICNMSEKLTNLCDETTVWCYIVSVDQTLWGVFLTLKFPPLRMKAVLKTKGDPTNKVANWLVITKWVILYVCFSLYSYKMINIILF